MKKITKIEAAESKSKKKLRVAAYCRVSTDNDAQLESLNTQKTHYESYISARNEWELAGIYVEMKISKMIQFENTNPPRKRRNKGFRHIRCCRESLFFVPWNDCV